MQLPASAIIRRPDTGRHAAGYLFPATMTLAQRIRALFRNGEEGVWYDPSDFSSMYQNASGATPVTSVEQPVGLLLDKRLGMARGPEILPNGTADVTLGASGWSYSNGIITASSVPADDAASMTVGLAGIYEISITFDTFTAGSASIYFAAGAYDSFGTIDAPGTYTGLLQATSTVDPACFIWPLETSSFTISAISVKKVLGNHASQGTAAARPVLSARVNQITKSQNFIAPDWSTDSATVTNNVIEAPDGTMTGAKVECSAGSYAYLYRTLDPLVVGRTYTVSGYVKAGTQSVVGIYAGTPFAQFDLSTGTVFNSGNCTPAIEDVGDGWFRVSITFVATATSQNAFFFMDYTVTVGKYFYVWAAQFDVGSVATRYQYVDTDSVYDTVGFPHYLKFDGVDDLLSSNAFSMAQPINRVSSVTPLTHANQARIFDNLSGISGFDTCALYDNVTANFMSIYSGAAAGGQEVSQGITHVFDEVHSGASSSLRLDSNAAVTGDAGTNNPTGINLGVGKHMNLYQVVMRSGGLMTTDQLERVRSLAMTKAGLALPPTNMALPSISGSKNVGEVWTADIGTWDTSGSTTYEYEWLDDSDVVIDMQNLSTYKGHAGLIGGNIKLRVTATNANGSTSATSAAWGPILPPNYTARANQRYFDPTNGSNANDGLTPGTAWKTITGVFGSIPADCELIFADGTHNMGVDDWIYRSQWNSPLSSATIRSATYLGCKLVGAGSMNKNAFYPEGGDVDLEIWGFDISEWDPTSVAAIILMENDADDVRIIGNKFSASGTATTHHHLYLSSGTSAANNIRNGKFNYNVCINQAGNGACVHVYGTNGPTGWEFNGNSITGTGRWGMLFDNVRTQAACNNVLNDNYINGTFDAASIHFSAYSSDDGMDATFTMDRNIVVNAKGTGSAMALGVSDVSPGADHAPTLTNNLYWNSGTGDGTYAMSEFVSGFYAAHALGTGDVERAPSS